MTLMVEVWLQSFAEDFETLFHFTIYSVRIQ